MKIQMLEINHSNIALKILDYSKAQYKIKTNLSFSVGFMEDNKFIIIFNTYLRYKKVFSLKITSNAIFETDCVIDDDFKESSFTKVNAPAIAFPYIRSFISNLTLNSGLQPVILPSYNFVALAEKKEQEEKNK